MKYDVNGTRWHRLSVVTMREQPIEIMAATCIDYIGVIVEWRLDIKKGWEVRELDTERGMWAPVDFSEEGQEIPPEPPEIWDDISQNEELASLQDIKETIQQLRDMDKQLMEKQATEIGRLQSELNFTKATCENLVAMVAAVREVVALSASPPPSSGSSPA